MARVIGKLTETKIRSLISKRANGPRCRYHSDGGGLVLCLSSNAASSWIYRYMIAGRERYMGLGPYPDVSLADARAMATDARRLKSLGEDPLEGRKAQRTAMRLEAARSFTFRDCVASYIDANQPTWKSEKHAKQWSSTLETYAMPTIGSLPIASVDVAFVHKILEPIWTTKPETASRVRGRIEAVIDWATARGYRKGENPARWKGHLENLFPARSKVQKVKHHAALPYIELPPFMAALEAQDGIGALALRFTILTAGRTGEVIGATWEEIDLVERVWTIPAVRMKSDRDHRVPLCAGAITILQKRQTENTVGEFVFPGGRAKCPLSNMAMLTVLRRMGRDDLTVHGFRSTFKDWAAEKTTFPNEVSEAALAHIVGDKVEAAYRRGDLFEKRGELMNAWAVYCTSDRPALSLVRSF